MKSIFAKPFVRELADQLAEGLRRLRQDADLTQKDMAKRLGLSHSTLHRVECGDYNTTLKVLETLCEALDCRPGDLFESAGSGYRQLAFVVGARARPL